MNTLFNTLPPLASAVTVNDTDLTVHLDDGRTLIVPVAWYPRLSHATPGERENHRLIGGGEGIHWPDLDEDISVTALVGGLPSRESPQSLQKWLESRK